jgi:hypothetical protein
LDMPVFCLNLAQSSAGPLHASGKWGTCDYHYNVFPLLRDQVFEDVAFVGRVYTYTPQRSLQTGTLVPSWDCYNAIEGPADPFVVSTTDSFASLAFYACRVVFFFFCSSMDDPQPGGLAAAH